MLNIIIENSIYLLLLFLFSIVFDFLVSMIYMFLGQFYFSPKLATFLPKIIITFVLVIFFNHIVVAVLLYWFYEIYKIKELYKKFFNYT